MKHHIAATAIFCVCGIAGSWTSLATESEPIVIQSRTWMNPQWQDIRTTLEVRQLESQTHTLRYILHAPGAVDLTAVHFFATCVATRLSAERGYTAWAMGLSDDELKKDAKPNRAQAEMHVALLNKGESPDQVSKLPNVKWESPILNDDASLRESCMRILRPEFMWEARS